MVQALRTDQDIKADVVDYLRWDDRIDASKITVTVENGTVTLAGRVRTDTAREAAADSAWSVAGVRSVNNLLEVQYAAGVALPPDGQIMSNVEDTFRWDPELNDAEIDVIVIDGWVTLRGTVDAYWKKARAQGKAAGITGVVGVTNELAVVPSRDLADVGIAEAIVSAIERDMRVSAKDVTVQVDDGRVTLSGIVPDWRARAAAENAAHYTGGVVDVENEIVIKSR